MFATSTKRYIGIPGLLLASLKDEGGRVLIPNFYDDVDPEFLDMEEKLLEHVDVGELEALKEELGIAGFVGV